MRGGGPCKRSGGKRDVEFSRASNPLGPQVGLKNRSSTGQLHMMEEIPVIKLAGGKGFQRALIFLGDKDCFADLGPRVELKGKSKASRNLQVIQRLIEIRCDS